MATNIGDMNEAVDGSVGFHVLPLMHSINNNECHGYAQELHSQRNDCCRSSYGSLVQVLFLHYLLLYVLPASGWNTWIHFPNTNTRNHDLTVLSGPRSVNSPTVHGAC